MIAPAGALGAGCSAAPEAGDDAFDAVDSSELSAEHAGGALVEAYARVRSPRLVDRHARL
jgi:hypothetical protein